MLYLIKTNFLKRGKYSVLKSREFHWSTPESHATFGPGDSGYNSINVAAFQNKLSAFWTSVAGLFPSLGIIQALLIQVKS